MSCICKVSAWASELRAVVYSREFPDTQTFLSTCSSGLCFCDLGDDGSHDVADVTWVFDRAHWAGLWGDLCRFFCLYHTITFTLVLHGWCSSHLCECVFSSDLVNLELPTFIMMFLYSLFFFLHYCHHYSADFLVTLRAKWRHSNAH